MKKIALFFLILNGLTTPVFSQTKTLFDDSRVSKIYLQLNPDSLKIMLDELVNDHYFPAQFVFDDGQKRDTVQNIGLRLRGNTSLTAQKKSFKVSFNEFETGRKYQGVRKLNLRGSHNDPTMIREKLFYEVWARAGMPPRRVAFVRLYINNVFRGLYSNVEEIDKEWLQDVYGNNDGNLFKCTWPADLEYKGPSQPAYKAILNNPETRAYDLTTNETEDDYTRLVALITVLHQPVDAAFPDNIRKILHVDGVLKAFAIDVATGNWDDYFYNKNNYYLYDDPATGRFEFVTFDTDNTFGVDWIGGDWAKRNCVAWLPPGASRPLATKLLAVPAFYTRYIQCLDSITRFITRPDSIFPRIDALHQLITPAAAEDFYRTFDYGYDLSAFHNGFTQTIDGHTPYGIKPFLETRYDSTIRRIAPLLTGTQTPLPEPFSCSVFPNPATDRLFVALEPGLRGETVRGELRDMTGRIVGNWEWAASVEPFSLPVNQLPEGMYRLRLIIEVKKIYTVIFIKI